eukprot:TRINITY_DN6367_c0_g1_i5.p1 TRINITY_DN6367_c0_g1~~TRINITY_DN6367_c0_g1_i5.p1  ORF type:complete len:1025 (+),score=205.87 TRINITY_DN6367_c0_g1_i5:375-3449(+)
MQEDQLTLYCLCRAIHLQTHLKEIDKDVEDLLSPNSEIPTTAAPVLQSFLKYLSKNGVEKYVNWINSCSLRLVSTVHPNETERNANLRHYATLFGKYLEWKKDFASIQTLPPSTPIYRARREQVNQLRRAIKAEIEAVWQTDHVRQQPIQVEAEAYRVLNRSVVIMDSFPQWVKFIKALNKEAFWRYEASKATLDPVWMEKFTMLQNSTDRVKQLNTIKNTFKALGMDKKPPRLVSPIITFSTWKGGDRDGNPYVTAAFSNKVFLDHKIFVLERYEQTVLQLLDSTTPSLNQIHMSNQLVQSLQKDKALFPYVQTTKPTELYRVKLRYIAEKLGNTLALAKEVSKRSGGVVKPLLSQSLPGPSGYSTAQQFSSDLTQLYNSLVEHEGKAQARGQIQDLIILVNSFGFHLNSIDFRQISVKNSSTLVEYLERTAEPREHIKFLSSGTEMEKQKYLVELLTRTDFQLDPFVLTTSMDTIYSLIVFADASKADEKAVGKFIISMCSSVSDILVVLVLLRLVGILEVSEGRISSCPFDVTGLFETIPDLKRAPEILRGLVSIPVVRNYIIEHRHGQLTMMFGYSDSVRDGSSLASDAQLNATGLQLKELENELNRNYEPLIPFEFIFYRGRGDTIPRGFGGSIEDAILSQVITTKQEDHTEQNRYLRRYFTLPSASKHYHSIYGAHLAAQIQELHPETFRYQNFFNFFGIISNLKYNSLVKTENGGKGDVFFSVLNEFSILPHLPKSHFASRPIARASKYNIDTIRAIPFVMALAQMRLFSSAFYGTGTAFELGSKILSDPVSSGKKIFRLFLDHATEEEKRKFSVHEPWEEEIRGLCKLVVTFKLDIEEIQKEERMDTEFLKQIAQLYPNGILKGLNQISLLLLDLSETNSTPLELLQAMYTNYRPFHYSLTLKESSLLIANKDLLDLYIVDATEDQKLLMEESEREAQLTKSWILKISKQDKLQSKGLKKNVLHPSLFLLHVIQSLFLLTYRKALKANVSTTTLRNLETYIQLTILAISEGLGFGG